MIIEEIAKHHDRKAFDCGVADLNQFLQQQARQKNTKHLLKSYILCKQDKPSKILGFYSLTGYSVLTPPEHRYYKQYPHPLNGVKLARLAVDLSSQGKGYAELLLVDAINRTVSVAEHISAIGLFVDPSTQDVVAFYKQYGFLDVNPDVISELDLWLPIANCMEIASSLDK